MMRDILIIGGVVVGAIAIGTLLFFFGPASLQTSVSDAINASNNATSTVPFTILEKGSQALSVPTRTNYRITNADDLTSLWSLVYGGGDAPNIPTIDFTKYEVLALFDGSHSTGGYAVDTQSITDAGNIRSIAITHETPNSNCSLSQAQTSPFEIIQVPKTVFPLEHEDIPSINPSCK